MAKTENDVKNLFVGQISWNVDDSWLAEEFGHMGTVVSARVITDRESGKSRGYETSCFFLRWLHD